MAQRGLPMLVGKLLLERGRNESVIRCRTRI